MEHGRLIGEPVEAVPVDRFEIFWVFRVKLRVGKPPDAGLPLPDQVALDGLDYALLVIFFIIVG